MRLFFEKIRRLGRNPFVAALFSFVLYRLALPPYDYWYLIFFVPMIWGFLVYQARDLDFGKETETIKEKEENGQVRAELSTGPSESEAVSVNGKGGFFFRQTHLFRKIRRGIMSFYGQIWAAAALFWLVINYWLTFPHPFLVLGYLALSLYLAVYVPLYLWLVRRLMIRLNFPILLASPLCWLAVEWLRKHIFGGYSFASLEHAFYRMPQLIQSAGFFGEYTVGLWIVLIGSGLALLGRLTQKKKYERAAPVIIFLLLLAVGNVLAGSNVIKMIGLIRDSTARNERSVRVALLQEPTCFSFPVPDELNLRIHREYLRLTDQALDLLPKPDLIVWPESSSVDTEIIAEEGACFSGMSQLDPKDRQDRMARFLTDKKRLREQWLKKIGTPILFGVGSTELKMNGTADNYNSALYFDGRGKQYRYDKMSLVMFGEYFPLIEYLPKSLPIRSLCNSVKPGKDLAVFPLYRRDGSSEDGSASKQKSMTSDESKKTVSPDKNKKPVGLLVNICFESSLPHFIAWQLDQLEKKNEFPSVLVNISNDGWFYHSWQIDFHLATHVFRAVENRKTVLSATHGGFSAGIGPDGLIFAQGSRDKPEVVVADFVPVMIRRSGVWMHHIPPFGFIFVCGLVVGSFMFPLRKKRR